MVTLSVTNARKNLGSWVKKAVNGEDVAILLGDHVVALRPVEVVPKEYAEREYQLASDEVRAISKNLHKKAKKARREGRSREFTGDIEAALQG
ncbi:MAG: hypothetical protein WC076_10855 [Terrimicrobiaceae bacterium]|nr:hypothetical protein [Terrimicrobiaceae bacterium]